MIRWGVLFLGVLAMAHVGVAQSPYWVNNVGGSGNDHVADVKVDAQGNSYVTGEFAGIVFINNIQIVSSGGVDVFVAKLGPNGQALWAVTGGGTGVDRGISLAIGNDGSISVAGQFMGEASLFGEAVTSAGGTMDVFVARLSAGDGSADWVRSGGASFGSDRPSMVTTSANGNIIATGEFRGTADFSGTTIISVLDTATLEPSADVFIVCYASDGDLLWLKHGAGQFTDRGSAVVTDGSNAVYVAGQFSDTLLLDTQHANTMYNATFLVKYDASGTEQWFRKCGGALVNQVRDMRLSNANELLLLGDLRGTTHFYDAQPNDIAAAQTYSYYVMRVGTDGEFIAATTMGSDDPITARGLAVSADSVAVLGEFKCQFTGLSAIYGSGLFMATGTQDLFVAKHRLSDLTFTGAQQYGGHNTKRAGRIAFTPERAAVFCGGYQELLVFPEDGTFWTGTGTIQTPVSSLTPYCGDDHYWAYGDIEANGGRDGFVGRAYAPGRPPYDVWRRDENGPCEFGPLEACMYTYTAERCADSMHVCYPPPIGQLPQTVAFDLPFGWNTNGGNPDQIGFEVSYLWNTGDVTSTVSPTTDGWYTCTVTPSNGCWSWTDSVYVIISASPDPLISDLLGINSYAGVFQTTTIQICDTSTWLWDPVLLSTDSIEWYENGVLLNNDSAFADTSGIYTLVITNEIGCMSLNAVSVVQTLSPELPNVTGADLAFWYQGEPLNGDTVYACETGGCVGGEMMVTWYVDGVPALLPPDVTIAYLTEPTCDGVLFVSPGEPMFWNASYLFPGWFYFTFTMIVDDLPCGETSYVFSLSDSVYIAVMPSPVVYPPLSEYLCDGDTIMMTLSGCTDCDSIMWSGPGVVDVSADGTTAWLDLAGPYQITAFAFYDEVTCMSSEGTFLAPPDVPTLFASVPDGTICQGDSILLWTTTYGLDLQWTGPGGTLGTDNDSIWVQDAGDYQLTMDVYGMGCMVSSASFELQFFGTPYVEIDEAGNVLCPGGSVELNVFADGPVDINWLPPLSGNSTTQVITAAGTYSVVLTSCGQTFQHSFTVIMGDPNATLITPGPYLICGDTPVELMAWPGQEYYEWQPSGATEPILIVDVPGEYWFYVSDEYGCMDTSDVVEVTAYDIAEPLSVQDTSLCEGGDVVLAAEGSGTIEWFDDAGLTGLVYTGNSWSISGVDNTTTYYVQQTDGPCVSDVLPVTIEVTPMPDAPEIIAPGALCEGDPLTLVANADAGSLVQWSSPNGTFTGTTWIISPVSVDDAGTYTVFITNGDCVGPSASVEVSVTDCDIDIPNVITPNGDGSNDGITLFSPTGDPLTWTISNRWGDPVRMLEGSSVHWNGAADGGGLVSDGVYFYVLSFMRPDGRRMDRTGYIHLIR